jgi:FAD-linked sulfhydryl oxidase
MSLGKWGPYFWGSLHLACLSTNVNLSEQEKEAVRAFVDSLTKLLPCPMCRTHFAEVLEKYPLETGLYSGPDLFKWSVNVHNEVNISIGKPVYTIEEAFNYWMNAMSMEKQQNDTVFDPVIIIVIIIMIMVLALFFINKR